MPNSTTEDAAVALVQKIVYSYYVGIGCFALLGNSLILTTLSFASRGCHPPATIQNRSTCILIVNMIFVKWFRGLVLLETGARRLLSSTAVEVPQTYRSCLYRNLPSVFTYPLAVNVLLLVVLDVLMQTCFGLWYKRRALIFSLLSLGFCWSGHIAMTVMALDGVEKGIMSEPCNIWNALPPRIHRKWNRLVTFDVVAAVVCYILSSFALWFQQVRSERLSVARKHQLKEIAVIRVSLTPLVALFSAVWTGYLLWTKLVLHYFHDPALQIFNGIFAPINDASNFLVYLFFSPRFRTDLVQNLTEGKSKNGMGTGDEGEELVTAEERAMMQKFEAFCKKWDGVEGVELPEVVERNCKLINRLMKRDGNI